MYGFLITAAGENMLARASAGEPLKLTGVTVGKGVVERAEAAKALTGLVEQVAAATSTEPVVAGGQLSMLVEYRNDMNGGLDQGFDLTEFGIFAQVGDDEAALLYYGGLGDRPQPVQAFSQGLDIHRFPVAIAVTEEVAVTLGYPAGAFVTHEELGPPADAAVQAHNEDLEAHAAAGFFRAVDEEAAEPAPVDADLLQGHAAADFRLATWMPTAGDVGAAVLVAPVTVTVDVAAWSGSGPWEQTVSVAGVTAEDEHIGVFPVDTADADARKLYEKAYGCLSCEAETVAGGIVLTCRDAKPEISFQVKIKGVR